MGFVVLPALIPDIPKVYDAYFAAFKGDLIADILFPGEVDDAFRQGHTVHTIEWWHKSTTQHTFKCLDTDSGDVVGMAIWDVYWRERGRGEEWKRPAVNWLQGREMERAGIPQS